MRWDSRIRFALLPVRCTTCYNMVWLERYTASEKTGKDYRMTPYTAYECQECKKIKKEKVCSR